MNRADLERLVADGESEKIEFKRSTGQLRRAGETLCGLLNAQGGTVLIGVTDRGELVGQDISDTTLRDVAAMIDRFEPPARIETERVWENEPAVRVRLEDLDHEEILRTREAAIQQRRISAGTSLDVGDILDRLGLRVDGAITQAAQVLYGTRFLPDYPRGLLKMGRFRGTKITGDILDNRQEHLHAFAIVREAMAFLDRTLPLAAHFPEGEVFREDRLPVPADALREIVLNAVMHRDYSVANSYVAIAVFDDRIEVRSVGGLPQGITAEELSGPHRSIPRNPLIAEAFHRTGAVEIWGRGTNRVIEACERHGVEAPSFEERSGALFVTFRAQIGPTASRDGSAAAAATGTRAEKILAILRDQGPLGSAAILEALGEGITRRVLQKELGRLRAAGQVTVAGRARATTYSVNDQAG